MRKKFLFLAALLTATVMNLRADGELYFTALDEQGAQIGLYLEKWIEESGGNPSNIECRQFKWNIYAEEKEWTEWESLSYDPSYEGVIISLEQGDTLCFRAGEAGNATMEYARMIIEYDDDPDNNQGKVAAGGNIMSLLMHELPEEPYDIPAVPDFCFSFFFYECTALTTAPNLPTPKSDFSHGMYCYEKMFAGCTSLTTLPTLYATSDSKFGYISEFCFADMFEDCTNITEIPEDYFTKFYENDAELNSSCFMGTFSGTGISSIPAGLLPFTSLNECCYREMFARCTNLATIPATLLPATTLANECYAGMFEECSSLTSLPTGLLQASTTAEGCYYQMFEGCTNLATIPATLLPATTLAKDCYYGMFEYCSSLTSLPIGLLQASTTAEGCYNEMFAFCTNLTTIPATFLPATTLSLGCYYSMFRGCSKLTEIPSLPATTLASYCYTKMFAECTKLDILPTLSAEELADYCYSDMFYNCTSLDTMSSNYLPATKLAKNCYDCMFRGCSKLPSAPILPASELKASCYRMMFKGCSLIDGEYELPASVLASDCYQAMFEGTNITKMIVGFSDWKGATTDWLPSTVTSFTCPLALPIREADWSGQYASYVPSGCNVYKTMMQDNDDEMENKLDSAMDATSSITINYKLSRTLYKDGLWNTICLPFNIAADDLSSSPLAGYKELKTFVSATVKYPGEESETLELETANATSIEAGKPYLISWNSGENITTMDFATSGIQVSAPIAVGESPVQFKGTFAPFEVEKDDKNILFVGLGSALNWPNKGGNIKGFRGYFEIDDSPAGAAIRRGMTAMLTDGRNTPTGNANVNADASRIKKLIEAGKVVIISNGERFDLNGRKL